MVQSMPNSYALRRILKSGKFTLYLRLFLLNIMGTDGLRELGPWDQALVMQRSLDSCR